MSFIFFCFSSLVTIIHNFVKYSVFMRCHSFVKYDGLFLAMSLYSAKYFLMHYFSEFIRKFPIQNSVRREENENDSLCLTTGLCQGVSFVRKHAMSMLYYLLCVWIFFLKFNGYVFCKAGTDYLHFCGSPFLLNSVYLTFR